MGPRVDSLSSHQIKPGQTVWAYGEGLHGATRVTVGDAEATGLISYDDVTLGFTAPTQPGGSTNWVQVIGADGSTSPCVGDGQLVTYLDDVFDPPRAELKLESVTPSPITAGRADSYWVLGAGLTGTSVVTLDESVACEFEVSDDTRLMIRVPEFRHDSSKPTVLLRVHTGAAHADLVVDCVPLADVVPEDTAPWIGHLEPSQLPASGGRLSVHGGGLNSVTHVSVGGLDATIEELHDDHIVVSVGSLAEHLYDNVAVYAVTPHAGTPVTDSTMLHVTAE